MKNLILGTTAMLLLAVQVKAQVPIPPPPVGGGVNIPAPKAPKIPSHSSSSVDISRSITITSPGRSTNVVDVDVNTNVVAPTVITSTTTTTTASAKVKNSYSYHWSSDQEQTDDPMKAKTFSKSFSLDRNDKINLANVYGSITIKTWDKSEIKVDVDIKSYANSEAEAQKLLDNVSIKATKDGDQVTYKTTMEERSGNWGNGSRNGKKWRREVKVYYTVYMPKSNALNVSQEYGSIVIDDYNGPTSLKVQYGNITGGDLNNANNYISTQYGGAKFNDINQAKIKHEYGSGLTIGTIGTIDLDAQYTTVNITTIKNSGNIRHEYGGGTSIGNANNLTINAHYVRTKINTLTGNAVARLEYGGLAVNSIESSVKSFQVTSDYSAVNLGFDANYNANFNVSTDYASFKYGTGITTKKLGDDKGYSSSKTYAGQIGKGGAANNVTVKAEYGSVTFK